jgi:hypothetical protein
MRKSIVANKNRKKKPVGRPATGHDPTVALRLPKEKIAAVDKWAEKNGVSTRSEALRMLVEKGLEKYIGAPVLDGGSWCELHCARSFARR